MNEINVGLDARLQAMADIMKERARQVEKFGAQMDPFDVPGNLKVSYYQTVTALARERYEREVKRYGKATWEAILREEVAEAFEEASLYNLKNLREELIQVAAVCVAWVECLEGRK